MKTTRAASTLKLDFASEAPSPGLPAVIAPEAEVEPDPPLRAIIQKPLTADTLTEMLANRRKRTDGWTPIRVAAFIERLAETGSVVQAVACVNMSVPAAYHLRNHPDAAAFREAWDSAMAVRFESLSEIAMDRITNGVEKIRWAGDTVVGHDRIFSDRLLIHMLNRCDPDRDRSAPVAGEARVCTIAGPRPGALPLAADFVVAAGTETGKLGWDPDDDYELDPEIAADVAAMHAAQAAREVAEKAASDALTAERAAQNAAIDKIADFNRDADAAWEERFESLTRGSKF